jgi:hypothetical protein
MVYTKTINDSMIINFYYVYHHLLSRINVLMCLNNQREIEIETKRNYRHLLFLYIPFVIDCFHFIVSQEASDTGHWLNMPLWADDSLIIYLSICF